MREKTAYSYHTFIFPFICDWKGKTYQVFDNECEDNIWMNVDVDACYHRVIDFKIIKKNKGYYDAYKFFNEAGRKIVFCSGVTPIVRTFQVKQEKLDGMEYIIGTEKKEYRIPIKSLSLKFYDTDIIVFILECENRKHTTIDDVKTINEYGRRLGFPFWPEKGTSCKKCAKYLKISNEDDTKILAYDNFLNDVRRESPEISLEYVSKIIRMLLNQNGSGYIFRGKSVSEENEIQMKALLEEKMFVASYICDPEFMRRLYNDYRQNDETFSLDEGKNILELMRVDLPGECSIDNKIELENYLKEHLYLTAFSNNTGKIMMVTEQAYIKVVSEPGYEEGYFRNAYVPLLIIPIVQRNSIEYFHICIQRLTEVAQKRINMSVIRRIMNVQQRYVVFRNQFLPGIVTAQKEGKFLYNKLQSELCVPDENKVLEGQVGKLFEQANINQSYAFSKWALALSLTSLTLSCCSYINTAQSISKIDFSDFSGMRVIIITFSLIILIFSIVILGVFNKRSIPVIHK